MPGARLRAAGGRLPLDDVNCLSATSLLKTPGWKAARPHYCILKTQSYCVTLAESLTSLSLQSLTDKTGTHTLVVGIKQADVGTLDGHSKLSLHGSYYYLPSAS